MRSRLVNEYFIKYLIYILGNNYFNLFNFFNAAVVNANVL